MAGLHANNSEASGLIRQPEEHNGDVVSAARLLCRGDEVFQHCFEGPLPGVFGDECGHFLVAQATTAAPLLVGKQPIACQQQPGVLACKYLLYLI